MGTAETILHHWANAIANSSLSERLQNDAWLVPTSQSIHIVAMSVIFGCALTIDLRLLGLRSRGRSVTALVRTLVPWMWGALAVSLLTGTLQTIIEPVRQFVTPAFWLKMSMIALVMTLTQCFASSVRHHAAEWDSGNARPGSARAFALLSLGLWIAIIACGRFIGYTWQIYA